MPSRVPRCRRRVRRASVGGASDEGFGGHVYEVRPHLVWRTDAKLDVAEWTKMTGADFLQLDPARRRRGGLAAWLTGALRDAVADGRLAVGARLPASRTLAAQLGVSRGVVVEAYQRLADEGLLSARSGGGTAGERASPEPYAASVPPRGCRLPTWTSPRACPTSRPSRGPRGRRRRGRCSPRSAAPTSATATRAACRRCGRRSRSGWAAPAASRSRPTRSWWSTASPRASCCWRGGWRSAAGPRSASRSRARYGGRVHLQRWGMTTVPVPVDGDGLDVAALDASGVDAVVVTPGAPVPDRRRARPRSGAGSWSSGSGRCRTGW